MRRSQVLRGQARTLADLGQHFFALKLTVASLGAQQDQQPSADLSTLHIDLGEKLLGKIAATATERHIAAATGSTPSLGKVKLLERTDEAYTFAIPVAGEMLTATVSPEGLVSPSFLHS